TCLVSERASDSETRQPVGPVTSCPGDNLPGRSVVEPGVGRERRRAARSAALVVAVVAALVVVATATHRHQQNAAVKETTRAASVPPTTTVQPKPRGAPGSHRRTRISLDLSAHSTTSPSSIWVVVNKAHGIHPLDFRPRLTLVRGYQVAR